MSAPYGPEQPYQPHPYGYPPASRTNALAVASLICSVAGVATCVSAPVGAVLGHVARRQIRERGEAGDGLALAGIVVGWVLTGLLMLALLIPLVIYLVSLGQAVG
jgi:hypothetical protein